MAYTLLDDDGRTVLHCERELDEIVWIRTVPALDAKALLSPLELCLLMDSVFEKFVYAHSPEDHEVPASCSVEFTDLPALGGSLASEFLGESLKPVLHASGELAVIVPLVIWWELVGLEDLAHILLGEFISYLLTAFAHF